MSDFKIVEPQLGLPSPASATGTTALWDLGYVAKGEDFVSGISTGAAYTSVARIGDALFQYCVGDTAAPPQSRGQLVMLRGNSAVLAGTVRQASNFPIGIAAGALSASNVYGWVQIQGACDYGRAHSAGNVAAGASAFVASTAGWYATTQGAAGARIWGLGFPVSADVTQSLSGTVYLQFPHMGPSSAL
jgi:hypothetical protein